jgi:hypothetical protein
MRIATDEIGGTEAPCVTSVNNIVFLFTIIGSSFLSTVHSLARLKVVNFV